MDEINKWIKDENDKRMAEAESLRTRLERDKAELRELMERDTKVMQVHTITHIYTSTFTLHITLTLHVTLTLHLFIKPIKHLPTSHCWTASVNSLGSDVSISDLVLCSIPSAIRTSFSSWIKFLFLQLLASLQQFFLNIMIEPDPL